MRTLEEIDNEIALLESKYEQVKGTETEVYTRIVGYHRSVVNWNKGKREEYDYRKTFNVNENQISQRSNFSEKNSDTVKFIEIKAPEEVTPDRVAFYKLFHSQFCRNCPPVVRFMQELDIPGEDYDVSSDLGIGLAKKYDILSTPTVIFFDENDNPIGTVHSIEELQSIFSRQREPVAV